MTKRVDAHMHIGTWDHPDFLGRSCTLADAVHVMKSANLSGAALCPTDQGKHRSLLAECKTLAKEGSELDFWLFPWIKEQTNKTNQAELKWAIENKSFVTGLKIHPSLSKTRICDAPFAPALKAASDFGWAVLVHCGRWQDIASYKFAVEAAEQYPNATFLLAHGGGDTPPLATAAAKLVFEKKLSNVFFEFSGLREYWVIERNVKLLGADRYLMGSDYGLAHPSMYIGSVLGMDLSDADKEKILGENARHLFGTSIRDEVIKANNSGEQ